MQFTWEALSLIGDVVVVVDDLTGIRSREVILTEVIQHIRYIDYLGEDGGNRSDEESDSEEEEEEEEEDDDDDDDDEEEDSEDEVEINV